MNQAVKVNAVQLIAKNDIKEFSESDPDLQEISKSINYFLSEAIRNLEGLLKEYERIPNNYAEVNACNTPMVRNTIKELKQAYSGLKWQEEGPSLSMMAKYSINV